MNKCQNCGREFEGNFCPQCGTPSYAAAQAGVRGESAVSAPVIQPAQAPAPAMQHAQAFTPAMQHAQAFTPAMQHAQVPAQTMRNTYAPSAFPESYFTGGAFANYFIGAISNLVSLITLFLAYPAMRCWRLRWKYGHTYYNGKMMQFTGKAMNLMGKYIIWWLLSIVTLGIYYIVCAKIAMVKWETKNVRIAGGDPNAVSEFDGKWYQILGVNLLAGFVTVITFFLGSFWAHCYKMRWFTKHKTIGGVSLAFDGTGLQYFGKKLAWWLLTVITLFIYSFWRKVKTEKWNVKHTHFTDPAALRIAPVASAAAQFAQTYVMTADGQYVPAAFSAQPASNANNSLAIAGFVLSLIPLSALIGFILSIAGLAKAPKYNGKGKGLAIAGIIIGAIFSVLILVNCFISYILPKAMYNNMIEFY